MKKFVIVVNAKYPTGNLLNAVGHLSIGFGDYLENKNMRTFNNFMGERVSYLTDYPLIILKAKNSNQLHTLYQKAKEANLDHQVFYDNMIHQTIPDQEKNISKNNTNALEHVAVGLFGNEEDFRSLTKKFSLFKN